MTQTLSEQLDKARQAYNSYYAKNRRHLAYKEVKRTLSAMLEKIAILEFMVKQGQ